LTVVCALTGWAGTPDSGSNGAITIFISNRQAGALREGAADSFPVRLAMVDLAGGKQSLLQEIKQAPGGPYKAVQILQQEYDGGVIPLKLPESIGARLLEYLNFGPQTRPFDCFDFAHWVVGMPHVHGVFEWTQWHFQDVLDGRDFEVGDLAGVGLVGDAGKMREVKHLGVYIGNGLFLWKFGPNHGLFVSDLAAMKEGFGSPDARRLRPVR
jgi:hypothetical protein